MADDAKQWELTIETGIQACHRLVQEAIQELGFGGVWRGPKGVNPDNQPSEASDELGIAPVQGGRVLLLRLAPDRTLLQAYTFGPSPYEREIQDSQPGDDVGERYAAAPESLLKLRDAVRVRMDVLGITSSGT